MLVELEDVFEGDGRRFGHDIEAGGVGHVSDVEGDGGLVQPANSVCFGLFGDERDGDELGHVVPALAGQRTSVGQRPEVAASGSADRTIYTARPCVIGGEGEVPVAELAMEVAEVVGGGGLGAGRSLGPAAAHADAGGDRPAGPAPRLVSRSGNGRLYLYIAGPRVLTGPSRAVSVIKVGACSSGG